MWPRLPRLPRPHLQVTLITRDIETPYSGMLPGHVAGFYTREECHIDLGRMAVFARARLIHAEATGVDRENKQVGKPPSTAHHRIRDEATLPAHHSATAPHRRTASPPHHSTLLHRAARCC